MTLVVRSDIIEKKNSQRASKTRPWWTCSGVIEFFQECFLESHCATSQGVVCWRVSPSDGCADRMMEEGMRCIRRWACDNGAIGGERREEEEKRGTIFLMEDFPSSLNLVRSSLGCRLKGCSPSPSPSLSLHLFATHPKKKKKIHVNALKNYWQLWWREFPKKKMNFFLLCKYVTDTLSSICTQTNSHPFHLAHLCEAHPFGALSAANPVKVPLALQLAIRKLLSLGGLDVDPSWIHNVNVMFSQSWFNPSCLHYLFVSLPVHGMHRGAEVNALPGLQHEDSGDKVGWWPSVWRPVSTTWSKNTRECPKSRLNSHISGSLVGEMIWCNI